MVTSSRAARWSAIVLILISCIGCDQLTKGIALEQLKGQPPQSFLGDLFRLEYAENPGGFLGLGGTMPAGARWVLLTLVNGMLSVGIGVALVLHWNMSPLKLLACALLLSGAAGNVIDRVRFDGLVVDFLNMGIGPLRTGIFNVADVAISTGAVLLILLASRTPAPAEATSK